MNQTDPTAAIEVWARMLCAADVHVHGDDHPTWQQLVGEPGQRIRDDYREAARWLLPRMTVATKPAAASAVVSPPTDRADLRDRIVAEVQRLHDTGAVYALDAGEPERIADAVLAVLGEQADRAAVLRWAADRIDAGWFTTAATASAELRRLAVEAHGTGTQQQGGAEARPVPLATPCILCQHPFNWHDRNGCQFGNEVNRCGCSAFAPGEKPAPVDPRSILGIETDEPAPVAQQPAAEVRHTGGNAEDCPACIEGGLNKLGYPWECPEADTDDA